MLNSCLRQYVFRHKVETFREMTAEFAKPADLFPEIYQDWGDEDAYSLKLGRGECAASSLRSEAPQAPNTSPNP